MPNLTNVDKMLVAAVTMILLILNNLGVFGLDASTSWWVGMALAVLNPFLVWLKDNAPKST